MEMTKIKWSRDMETRCLALLGGGTAKKVAKAAMAAIGKKPEKPEKHVKSSKPTEAEEHMKIATAVEPEPAAPAAPKAEVLKAEITDYPAIFNFDAPEFWDDFRVALNMASLKA